MLSDLEDRQEHQHHRHHELAHPASLRDVKLRGEVAHRGDEDVLHRVDVEQVHEERVARDRFRRHRAVDEHRAEFRGALHEERRGEYSADERVDLQRADGGHSENRHDCWIGCVWCPRGWAR